jgi:hypothetical protein
MAARGLERSESDSSFDSTKAVYLSRAKKNQATDKKEEKKLEQANEGIKVIHREKDDDDTEADELTEQDLELIKIYGPSIKVVRWLFENDREVRLKLERGGSSDKQQKKAAGKNSQRRNKPRQS